MSEKTTPNANASSRREFLKTGTAALAGTALAANAALLPSAARASGADTLKVGLVGCGGRGTGAAKQALTADPNTELVAVSDAFANRIEGCLNGLKKSDIANRVKVDADRQFVGLDGYRKVIDAVDVVLLATPPGFRPVQLRAAVEAGKHIFTEKPMATDGVGARSVFESVRLSKQKNIAVVAGYCWRYDLPRKALFEKVLNGEIGDVRAVYGTYYANQVKPMPPASDRPSGITDLEWMVRNWYNFTWLSGDGYVEQACHTVDWVAWAFGDRMPVSCTAVGGRQIPAEGGNIYDHVEVNYVWEDDARGFVAQRQIGGCYRENSLYILGSKGTGKIAPREISISDLSGDRVWKYEGPSPSMYQTEHDEFFASIRSGDYINDGDRMATSTLMGVMGRMAGYTGQQVTWDMAVKSQEQLVPEITDGWNTKVDFPEMARPGVTQFT